MCCLINNISSWAEIFLFTGIRVENGLVGFVLLDFFSKCPGVLIHFSLKDGESPMQWSKLSSIQKQQHSITNLNTLSNSFRGWWMDSKQLDPVVISTYIATANGKTWESNTLMTKKGDINGAAFDDCGICSGGNTSHVANTDKCEDGCCFW